MISCLCVTRGDRLELLAEVVSDFRHQVFANRELLILHDADVQTDEAIRRLLPVDSTSRIRVHREPSGQSLGQLRNRAVALAQGEWVCQWDDDDRSHPERLRLQWDCAQDEGAVANFLVDQLQWFRDDGLLFWSDWSHEPYPMNFIQGTMLARRDALPQYPDTARGEDTQLVHALLRQAQQRGQSISRLAGAGWCYVYSFHGANVWDRQHHEAIARAKHLAPARLLPRLGPLALQLAGYSPPLPSLRIALGQTLRTVQATPTSSFVDQDRSSLG